MQQIESTLLQMARYLLAIEWDPVAASCPECEGFHLRTAPGGEVSIGHADTCELGRLCVAIRWRAGVDAAWGAPDLERATLDRELVEAAVRYLAQLGRDPFCFECGAKGEHRTGCTLGELLRALVPG